MNKSKIVATLVVVAIIFSGCAKKTPSCSDEQTVDLLKQVVMKELDKDNVGAPALSIQIHLDDMLTKEHNEKVGSYTCRAKLIIDLPADLKDMGSTMMDMKSNKEWQKGNQRIVAALKDAGFDGKSLTQSIDYSVQLTDNNEKLFVESIGNHPTIEVLSGFIKAFNRENSASKALFDKNCASCHGQNGAGVADAQGDLKAPVLNDSDRLYAGTFDEIQDAITSGRSNIMVGHKDILSGQQIEDVAKWIKANGEGKGGDAAVAAGKVLFISSGCGACHGNDAKGIKAMYTSNLNDNAWRFSGSLESIKRTIAYGVNVADENNPMSRVAVMPKFGDLWREPGSTQDYFTKDEVSMLAKYVIRLGQKKSELPGKP